MQNPRQMTTVLPQLTVIGLGPGGLSASIEAAKLGLRVVVFTRKQDYVPWVQTYLLARILMQNPSQIRQWFSQYHA